MSNDPPSSLPIPELLAQISDPPKRLYKRGEIPDGEYKYLTVVGSRKYTDYGRNVCERLIADLAGYPIVIVSGLALGIDALAHTAALQASLKTIAIPGSGLSDKVLYPAMNRNLAHRILESGGALISEYEPDFKATNWSFPRRNRIMAGISHATLVIEATEKSGSRITARLATEYNREVMTVPGSIFSPMSEGTHALLREGATPVTSGSDILEVLGITELADSGENRYLDCTDDEKKVLELLSSPLSKSELMRRIDWPAHQVNIVLTTLEIKGFVKESLGVLQRL